MSSRWIRLSCCSVAHAPVHATTCFQKRKHVRPSDMLSQGFESLRVLVHYMRRQVYSLKLRISDENRNTHPRSEICAKVVQWIWTNTFPASLHTDLCHSEFEHTPNTLPCVNFAQLACNLATWVYWATLGVLGSRAFQMARGFAQVLVYKGGFACWTIQFLILSLIHIWRCRRRG